MKTLMLSIFAGVLMLPVVAQNPQPSMRCSDQGSDDGSQARFCEIREQTIGYGGQLSIDGGQNGGVTVKGWDRGDVLVRSKVEAQAGSEAEARSRVSQVRVTAGAGRVEAEGPAEGHWSVSYEVFAPKNANLQITTHNGGVGVSDINGSVNFSAVNGGVRLSRVNGHVQGKTQNGGLHIELAGTRWDGEGMDVSTTNGGVHLSLPENYSARLETSTVNGGMRADYPLTVSGKIGKQLSATLGSGGATLRVATVNGGVQIGRI